MHIHSQATAPHLRKPFWWAGCVIISAKTNIEYQFGLEEKHFFLYSPMKKPTTQTAPPLWIHENNERSCPSITQCRCAIVNCIIMNNKKEKKYREGKGSFLATMNSYQSTEATQTSSIRSHPSSLGLSWGQGCLWPPAVPSHSSPVIPLQALGCCCHTREKKNPNHKQKASLQNLT